MIDKLSEKVRNFLIKGDLESANDVISEASIVSELRIESELNAARRLWLIAFSSIWEREPVPSPNFLLTVADLRLQLIGSLQIEAIGRLIKAANTASEGEKEVDIEEVDLDFLDIDDDLKRKIIPIDSKRKN